VFWPKQWLNSPYCGAGNILVKWSKTRSEAIINGLSIPDQTRSSEIRRDNGLVNQVGLGNFF